MPRGVAGGAPDGGAVMEIIRKSNGITDDEGKPVRLLDTAGMSEWPSKGDERIERMLVRVRTGLSRRDAPMILLGFLIWLAFVGVYVALSFWFPVLSHGSGAVFVVIANLTALLIWRLRLRAGARRFVELVLEDGLCPICGYNFAGLNFEGLGPEALVRCPECGSSWLRGRIERAAPFAPGSSLALPTRLVRQRQRGPGSWSVIDDAGSPVKLVHPRLSKPIDAAASPGHRARLLGAQAIIRGNRRWVRGSVAALLVLVAVGLLIGCAADDLAYLPIAFMVDTVLGVLAIAAWLGNFAYSPLFVRRVMLENALCPTCGADLQRMRPTGIHNRIRCSQCRSEWDAAHGKSNEPASG